MSAIFRNNSVTVAQISDASEGGRSLLKIDDPNDFSFVTLDDSFIAGFVTGGTTETQTPVTSLTFDHGVCTAAS